VAGRLGDDAFLDGIRPADGLPWLRRHGTFIAAARPYSEIHAKCGQIPGAVQGGSEGLSKYLIDNIKFLSVGENVDLRPALQIQLHPGGEEVETGLGHGGASLPRQHDVEGLFQPVQEGDVVGGIGELTLG
jgi:hypothetical protein